MMRKTRKRNIKKRKTQKRIFFGGTPQTFKLLILDSYQVKSISNHIDNNIKLYMRTPNEDSEDGYYYIKKKDNQTLSEIKNILRPATKLSSIKLILIKPIS